MLNSYINTSENCLKIIFASIIIFLTILFSKLRIRGIVNLIISFEENHLIFIEALLIAVIFTLIFWFWLLDFKKFSELPYFYKFLWPYFLLSLSSVVFFYELVQISLSDIKDQSITQGQLYISYICTFSWIFFVFLLRSLIYPYTVRMTFPYYPPTFPYFWWNSLTSLLIDRAFGIVFLPGIFLFLWLVTNKKGFGIGDILFGFSVGGFLGGILSICALFLSFIIGGLFSFFWALIKYKKISGVTVPYLPFLSLSLCIVFFMQEIIIRLVAFYISF